MPRATRYYNWLVVHSDHNKHELLKAAYPNWVRGYHDLRLICSDELIIYAELLDTLSYVTEIGWLGFKVNKAKQEVEIFLTVKGKSFLGPAELRSGTITARGVLLKRQWENQSVTQGLETAHRYLTNSC